MKGLMVTVKHISIDLKFTFRALMSIFKFILFFGNIESCVS